VSVILQAGVARTRLSPPAGVELAGWGYYLGRTWQRVRDHTAATALVLDDGDEAAALVAVDLLYADAEFTREVRRLAHADTGLRPEGICVASSHSHNTPTLAFIRGAGEVDPDYRIWAARQTAHAVILAWQQRRPARLSVGKSDVVGWTYNRTRADGPVDTRLSVWRIDDVEGRPLAAVVNFQAHPVVMMSLGADELRRDNPGEITDLLEARVPGLTALYLQGSCGDVNYDERCNNPEHCHDPGLAVADLALNAFTAARPVEVPHVKAVARRVVLPTRRWTRAEIQGNREEAEYRLRTHDTTGWLDGLARACVNRPHKLPERYGGDVGRTVQAVCRFAVEWTDDALRDLETQPETLTTEVQAIRAGDAFLVTNGSELFTTLALETRRQWGDDLMIVGYANDSIGYVPDAYDIERRSYAATQSPKFKNQFPFTAASGPALVQGMLDLLQEAAKAR
jgi:neutral ceramidase